MTHMTASVIAMSLVATAASFSPASAQDRRTSMAQNPTTVRSGITIRSVTSQSYNAGYQAALRRNAPVAARAAYNRGYRDALNALRVNSSRYAAVATPRTIGTPGYSAYARYNGPMPAGYSSYARYNGNVVVPAGYSSYARYNGVVPAAYDSYARYEPDYDSSAYVRSDTGYNPIGNFLNALFAPITWPAYAAQRDSNLLAYCAARYRSFDPVSGTYLATDGNRYYCS
jgi:hypothetical protein